MRKSDASDARRVPVRLRCVHQGRTSYPYVGDLSRAGLEVYHHGTRQSLPLPWQELIRGGAELYGCSPDEFLTFLRSFVIEPTSGPSARPVETADACSSREPGAHPG
jgi:hypothetical protein